MEARASAVSARWVIMNTTDRFNTVSSEAEPRPYPLWWDYVNGAVVALIMVVTAAMVLMWMVGVSMAMFR